MTDHTHYTTHVDPATVHVSVVDPDDDMGMPVYDGWASDMGRVIMPGVYVAHVVDIRDHTPHMTRMAVSDGDMVRVVIGYADPYNDHGHTSPVMVFAVGDTYTDVDA